MPTTTTLYVQYFELTRKHMAENSHKSLVLLQVGAFYEMYNCSCISGKNNPSLANHVPEVCELLGLNLSVKYQRVSMSGAFYNIQMGGFILSQLERYLPILTSAGYTVPVYDQEYNGKNTPRNLSTIYSAGTYFQNDELRLSNHILCAWIYLTNKKDKVHMGVATMDTTTAKTSIAEFTRDYHHQPTTYDDIERSISIYRPSEIILIGNLPSSLLNDIAQFTTATRPTLHIKSTFCGDEAYDEPATKCDKQTQQLAIVSHFFPKINAQTFFSEYAMYPIATQAFCYLLNFVQIHNARLVSDMEPPDRNKNDQRLVLANNCLEQLNIIDRHDTHLSGTNGRKSNVRSLITLLDECITPIGQREFRFLLQNPTTNEDALQESYALTEHLLNYTEAPRTNRSLLGNDYTQSIREYLFNMRDIEHFKVKANLAKTAPSDFAILDGNLKSTIKLLEFIKNDNVLNDYIEKTCDNTRDKMIESFTEIRAFLNTYLNIDECAQETSAYFTKNVFKTGHFPHLDEKQEMLTHADAKIKCIHEHLNGLIGKTEKKSRDSSFVKLNVTDKTPMTMSLTKRRTDILKNAIAKEPPTAFIKYEAAEQQHELEIDMSLFSYRPKSHIKESEMVIVHPELEKQCHGLFDAKETMVSTLRDVFAELVKMCVAKFKLDVLVRLIRHIDVAQCKAYVARRRNLCKPTICTQSDSFVRIEGLRHCLVENVQTDETYVCNDVALGQDLGFLLYGTNAVGKTCLIKAVGMAVIMAQAGLYVPCTSMTYSPFQYLFTRIVNRDDLFKGMSTFAMEMSELRTILNLCNNRSLVLGDELCSGTENTSAISIFVAGLETLIAARSCFIFATHFHELKDIKEVKALPNLGMKHMRVYYDAEADRLVYNRKLEEGSGDAMYGLEVCRSLALPNAFLERAHAIRVGLTEHSTLAPSVMQQKTSRYSDKKLMGMCQMCKKTRATETHHIVPQKDAVDGYVTTADGSVFPKDHPANLMPICKDCHKKETRKMAKRIN